MAALGDVFRRDSLLDKWLQEAAFIVGRGVGPSAESGVGQLLPALAEQAGLKKRV